jgi:hypothetical protein
VEGELAIGAGYVLILLPAVITYIVVTARRISLEKRLDALVQISRIAGDAVGSEEIRRSLEVHSDPQRISRWGTVLVVAAIGPISIGLFGDIPGVLQTGLVIEALGWGLIVGGKLYPDGQTVAQDA